MWSYMGGAGLMVDAGRLMSRRPRVLRFEMILSFLPLIAFSLLTRVLPSGDVGVAGLVAALFTAPAVAGFAGSAGTDRWLATWAGSGVGLVVGLVILALIPVMPLTGQFTRPSTPKAYWASPTFKKINRVLSAGWGAAIFASGVSRSSPRPSSAAAATAWPTC